MIAKKEQRHHNGGNDVSDYSVVQRQLIPENKKQKQKEKLYTVLSRQAVSLTRYLALKLS